MEKAGTNGDAWDGWGTALKPGYEPIVVARKPLEKRSVASNVVAYGTGGINIDASRIAGIKEIPGGAPRRAEQGTSYGDLSKDPGTGSGWDPHTGRWPANVLLSHDEDCVLVGSRVVKGDSRDTGNGTRPGGFVDTGADSGDGEPNAPVYGDSEVEVYHCVEDCPIRLLDEQVGDRKSGTAKNGLKRNVDKFRSVYSEFPGQVIEEDPTYGDSGSVSRFFYTSKVSKKERGWGLDKPHTHPTAKPVDLMRYLVRMITPPGGCVLDPFMGSGTTIIAAALEGFDSVGIDQDAEYAEVARRRVEFWYANGPPK